MAHVSDLVDDSDPTDVRDVSGRHVSSRGEVSADVSAASDIQAGACAGGRNRTGCADEAERAVSDLVLQHLSLARSLAMRYRDRGEYVDDLIQVANLGLVKAAQGYRPELGLPFTAYAVPTITGELRRHFRDHGWDVRPPRRLQELRVKVTRAEQELAQQLGRSPRTAEIAERLHVSVREIEEARSASAGYASVSIEAMVEAHPGGQVGADGLAVDDGLTDAVVDEETVRPLLRRLDPRTQKVLALRFFGGATQQEIAAEIGVTQMQVSRIITQALRQLRQAAEGACGPRTISPRRVGT